MEQWIALCDRYGIGNLIIVILTVLIVNVVKLPMKKHAAKIESFGREMGLDADKSAVTRIFAALPFGAALVLFAVKELILRRHELSAFDYAQVIRDTALYGGLSVAVYELIVNQIKGLVSKPKYKAASAAYRAGNGRPAENENKINQEENDHMETNFERKGTAALYSLAAAGKTLTDFSQAQALYRRARALGAETLYIPMGQDLFAKCVSETDVTPVAAWQFRREWERADRPQTAQKEAREAKTRAASSIDKAGETAAPQAEPSLTDEEIASKVRRELKRILTEVLAGI